MMCSLHCFPIGLIIVATLWMVAAKPVLNSETSSHRAKRAPVTTLTARDDPVFEWSAIGDSWTSGVAYSAGTVYSYSDFSFCYRTSHAWGAQMEADEGWTKGEQQFHFQGCGGTLLDNIPKQLEGTGNSQMMIGTLGGNNGFFGDIARACIYQPKGSSGWGECYDNDPDGEGDCKKNLQKSRDFIDNFASGLRSEFKKAIDQVMEYKQRENQRRERFDLYVSSYVEFFDDTTDECSEWTFGRWFSERYCNLVKELRAEMNELVRKFNDAQADVIKNYEKPAGYDYNVHYIQTSPVFDKHRFCESGHNYDNQWTSADVWIWNLQWNNGDLETDPGGKEKPEGAPDGPFAVMSLDTTEPEGNDFDVLKEGDPKVQQSGFGWTARPFHPKPRGYEAMKNHFIQTMKNDKIPGLVGVSGGSSGTCKATVKEIWTCEDSAENLYAELTITGSDGKILYSTPQSTSSPGLSIDDGNPLHLKKEGMNETLVVTGEHQNDYIQFGYGESWWTSGTTEGDARCELGGDDWDKNGPSGCPNAPAITRTFKCQYPC